MSKKENQTFTDLLKKYTTTDNDFTDMFFGKFKMGGELDFDIKDINAAKYLQIALVTLRKRLLNAHSKHINFIENVDYVKIREGKTTAVTYMINYPCFERLAMSGDSAKSEAVRLYFVKIREFLTEHQKIIYTALENRNENLKKYVGFSCIYFFVIDERKPNLIKSGRTDDIIQRLRNYNVGRIKDVELDYLAIVKNPLIIENCIGAALKENKIYPNREIYEVSPEKLKQVIKDCYCKYVTKKENDTMYQEIADLLGLYTYTKGKTHMKPYIVIDGKLKKPTKSTTNVQPSKTIEKKPTKKITKK